MIFMAQDISPNGAGGVSSTNTMNPRNITPASAGSVSPTIISQNAQDRRRRAAAEREERRRQSLAANVERAEVEREYRQLRAEEEAANRRAEQRKAAAQRERVTIYEGGIYTPLNIRRVPIADLVSLKGAADPVQTPQEINQYQAITGSGGAGNLGTAYAGLDKLRGSVNNLLRQEAAEKLAIQRARGSATLSALSYNSSAAAAASAPMTASAREAHERLISDPNTSPEMRAQLTADLKRDSQIAQERGVQLTAAEEANLSENWYRGGTREQNEIAQNYLGAAGSRYDVASSNRSVDNRFATQLRQSEGELQQRYKGSSEINNPDNTPETTAALRANQEGARQVLDTLYKSGGDTEKQRFETAQERRYAAQDSALQEYLRTNPIEDNSRYVESILRVSDDRQIDLSSDAFFMEQGRTEKIYGSDWASAGGETAEDAAAAGRRSTGYSSFKGTEGGEEFILVDAEGKRRYTLKLGGSAGGFAIYGWSGDLVGSGQSAQGLAGALKNLGIPFDESGFNPARPDADRTPVELKPETDISGINTAAAFRAATLGTLRSNEEIIAADDSRRAAEKSAQDAEALRRLDESMTEELGHTIRIGGDAQDVSRLIQTPGMYVPEGAESKAQVRSSDITMVSDPAVDNALKSAGDLLQRVSPVAAVAGAVTRTDSKRIEGADTGEPDFIVTQNEGSLAELSDMLISGSEKLGSANDAFNSWVQDLTGRKLIETEYGAQEKSWADIAGDLSGGPLQFGFKIARENLAKGLGFDAEPDLMTETRRSVNRQVIEAPLYAGSLIKIADSIASSGAEGGVPAAAAAAGFWGARAGEGLVSEAVTNPRKLTADLTAGLAVGAGASAAAKPLVIAGKRVAVIGGRGTGLINPHVRSVTTSTETDLVAKAYKTDIVEYILNNPTVDLNRVESSKVFSIFEKDFLGVNRPTHPDMDDYYGGVSKHVSYGTPNEYAREIQAAGEQVNIQASTDLFKNSGRIPALTTRVLQLRNVPSISQKLSDGDKALLRQYLYGKEEMPAAEQLRIYNIAQDFANEIGAPVALPTSKTLHYIGEANLRRVLPADAAEAEVGIVVPNNLPGMRNAAGELNKKIMYKLPNLRFAGFESERGIRVDIVDFAQGSKKSNLPFPIENLRDTIKDTGFAIDKGRPTFYSKGNALYDAIIGERKILKERGKVPTGPLDQLTFGAHGTEHVMGVAANAFALRAGSANPEVQKLSDNVLNAMAYFHDAYKIGDSEMYLPHAERTAFLMRRGLFDKLLKDEFGVSDAKDIEVIASAIEKHTKAQPGILGQIRYRPTAPDALLATADRLDLVRFGVKPNPKKLFMHKVLDEPWSWTSGELMPPAPKKGTFTMPDMSGMKLSEVEQRAAERITGGSGSGRYPAISGGTAGTFAGALGFNASRSGKSGRPAEKSGTADKSDSLGFTKKDQRYFENYYRQKKPTGKSGYYGRGQDYKLRENYGKGYEYNRRSEYPKDYDFFKGYSKRYSSEYTIEPKGYTGDYRRLNYLMPGSYVMGDKYGNSYKVGKYNLGGYLPQPRSPVKFTDPFRPRRRQEKKSDRKVERPRKFTLENVEIPIVRAEEALFSKRIGALELPAEKQTFYEFGNILTMKKPKTKKRKRRSK